MSGLRNPFKKTAKSVARPPRVVNTLSEQTHRNIKRIVLTGGPCGGKTTGLQHVGEFLKSRGFNVFTVPEAATLMMNAGVSFAGCTKDQLIDTQAELCRVQLNLEDSFYDIASQRDGPAVILSDRGAMDGKAYLPEEYWNELLKRNKWSNRFLRDARYDGVVFLSSAACGAEDFYSNANNQMRSESIEEARRVDATLQNAWLGHPHCSIIDNSTGFAGKLQRMTEWVCQLVGLPVPSERVKRFLVSNSLEKIPVQHTDFLLTKVYLTSPPTVQRRLETRTSTTPGSRPVYRYKEVRYDSRGCEPWDVSYNNRIVDIRRITRPEYLMLMSQASPDRAAVRQSVRNFIYKDLYFSHVRTLAPVWAKRLDYVEVTTSKSHDEVELPPWLLVEQEVTDDQRFTSYVQSRITTDKQ